MVLSTQNVTDEAQYWKKLARELHALHRTGGLLAAKTIWRWATPKAGFLHDNTLNPKLKNEIVNHALKDHPGPHVVIGYLWDWEFGTEGIAFTDSALFVTSPKNSERFSLSFEMLESAACEAGKTGKHKILLTTVSGTRYVLDSALCNLPTVCAFLQKTIALHLRPSGAASNPAPVSPRWDGLVSTVIGLDAVAQAQAAAATARTYANNIRPVQPHGFWAERANHLYDKVLGKDAQLVGGDNYKNGADRSVDGVLLQSKYCKTASKSVAACFDDNGTYKYWNPDGSAMKLEVPKDQYELAIRWMARRIKAGKIPGVSDPQQANLIVRPGNFTYNQVLMLKKAGTIESLTYDTINGLSVAGAALGLSSVLSFAVALWGGKALDDALSEALSTGFKVGGTALLGSVLSAQLGRTAIDGGLRVGTDWLVNQLSYKTTRRLASAAAGKTVTGDAAVNSLSKLMRGNIIAATATTVVLSAEDIYQIFQGGISGTQFFKNVTRTASGVAGGVAGAQGGALGGAAIGTVIFPGPGTAVGGAIGGLGGGLGGGYVVQWAASFVLDKLIEDDAAAMVKILEEAFVELAQLYLLSVTEAECVMQHLGLLDMPARLRAMYASSERKNYGRQMLEPLIERSIRQRRSITPPSREELRNGLRVFVNKTISK